MCLPRDSDSKSYSRLFISITEARRNEVNFPAGQELASLGGARPHHVLPMLWPRVTPALPGEQSIATSLLQRRDPSLMALPAPAGPRPSTDLEHVLGAAPRTGPCAPGAKGGTL